MKKFLWILVIIIVILAAVFAFNKVSEKASPVREETATSTPVASVVQPNYTFKYKFIKGGTASVDVYDGAQLVQTVSAKDAEELSIEDKNAYIENVDVNFDGYKDLAILTCLGATGNQCFDFFLWNPSTKMFDYSEEFSEANSFPDKAFPLQLHSFWNMGCAGACYVERFYKVESNKPVLLKEITQELNDNATMATKVTKELKDGTYVTSTTTSKFENI
jgi:hypothetical protein